MGFKLFILSLAVLAVAVSASSLCKCGTDLEEEKILQDSTSKSVEKYSLKMNKDGRIMKRGLKLTPRRKRRLSMCQRPQTMRKQAI
ncbi:hypothetical protein OS493_027314 [Desmophyllum pertusum]|uniref:Uncharacterized protein n=1 Tax=Desmophyllum pertusum TaxID=174260 RepID=A0A9W9YXJ9_9CNID|nr:hypothetical protein OS493_027314 [Desmophyllum pertusum]